MKLWFYGLLFRLMLFGLVVLLKIAGRRSSDFKARLGEKNYTMFIGTRDGKHGRWFRFEGGFVFSGSGAIGSPGFSMIWENAMTGFQVMRKGDQLSVMTAMNDGRLKMDGDYRLVMWFQETMNRMRKALKKK